MQYSLISQLFNIRQDIIRLIEDTEFDCIMFDCKRLGLIDTSVKEYYNNKKLSLKYNWYAQRQRHKYLIIS